MKNNHPGVNPQTFMIDMSGDYWQYNNTVDTIDMKIISKPKPYFYFSPGKKGIKNRLKQGWKYDIEQI